MRALFVIALTLCWFSALPAAADNALLSEPLEQIEQRFLASEDLQEQLPRLLELEQQALQLAVDQPLKLGPIGSAILDIYPASQTGHYVMGLFYAHIESDEAKANHDQTLQQIQAAMRKSRTGEREQPYQIMTVYDAHTFVRTQQMSPVGSIYQSTEYTPFGFMLLARPEGDRIQQLFFDVSNLLQGFLTEEQIAEGNPWPFMQVLAARMDSAAQTAIGAYLTGVRRFDQAIDWLKVAARYENVLANTILARIYLIKAEEAEDDADEDQWRELALENHMHAIALGSTESMYTLATLYLRGDYGEEEKASAIPLLQQAGDLQHAESLLYLGHLYNIGEGVEQDSDRANDYFSSAALLDNPQAILNYGRFLISNRDQQNVNSGAVQSLQNLADDNPEAMVILGNMYARGVGMKRSTGRAVRWYRRAMNKAPDNADLVNEVAWTLTVSDVDGLKRTRYARKLMNRLMQAEDSDANTRPEYLDTWAATYAANGNFERAIEIQRSAIEQANIQERQDVLEILEQHLEAFKSGATITEAAP